MASNTIVKKEFVRRTLIDTGARIRKDQLIRIHKLLQFRTGNLEHSKDVSHFKVSTGDNFDGKLTIKHPIYERFLDMRKVRGKKRSFPIHNSVIWGNWERMLYKLNNDFTEAVQKELFDELKDSING